MYYFVIDILTCESRKQTENCEDILISRQWINSWIWTLPCNTKEQYQIAATFFFLIHQKGNIHRPENAAGFRSSLSPPSVFSIQAIIELGLYSRNSKYWRENCRKYYYSEKPEYIDFSLVRYMLNQLEREIGGGITW